MKEVWQTARYKTELFLSNEVKRALKILSEAQSDETHIVSPDEIANALLQNAISEKWPQLLTYNKEIDKLKKKVIETLKTPSEHDT